MVCLAASFALHALLWFSLSLVETGSSSQISSYRPVSVRLVAAENRLEPADESPKEPAAVSDPPPKSVKPQAEPQQPTGIAEYVNEAEQTPDTGHSAPSGNVGEPAQQPKKRPPDALQQGPVHVRPEDVVKRVKPVYPLLSRRKGEQGEVLLRVFVDESGYVADIRLERSSGHDTLDRSAIKAVQAWSFTPGEARELFVPVQFTLVH